MSATKEEHSDEWTDRPKPDRRSADERQKEQKEKVDQALDDALEDTFPSSDPPSISQPQKPGPTGAPRK